MVRLGTQTGNRIKIEDGYKAVRINSRTTYGFRVVPGGLFILRNKK